MESSGISSAWEASAIGSEAGDTVLPLKSFGAFSANMYECQNDAIELSVFMRFLSFDFVRKLLMAVQTAKEMINRTFQLAGSAFDGLAYGLRLVRDRNGLVTFKARFHHTALIVFPAFFTVLVAEVDFDTGNMRCQLAQRVFHLGFGLPGNLFVILDRVV